MKFLLPILLVILIAVSGFSCAAPDFMTKAQVDALIAQNIKTLQTTIDALRISVDAANSKINGVYTKDEVNNIFLKRSEYSSAVTGTSYSKSESDSLYGAKITDLTAQLTALKDRVTKLETSGTPTGGGTTGSGFSGGTSNGVEVTFTPMPSPIWGGTTSQTFNFSMSIVNKSSTFKYVRLQALLTSYNGQPVNIETATLIFNAPYVSGDIACPLTYYQSQASCSQMSGTWSGNAQPIGPGQSAYVYSHLTLKHASGGTMWNVNITPIALDYP